MTGLLWLAIQDMALGSYFVPIDVPDDWNLSDIDVDANGNEIREGTLHHNGGPYVRFGPNEDFTHLYGFILAGPKVVLGAKTGFIKTPKCRGACQVIFNGPNPRIWRLSS